MSSSVSIAIGTNSVIAVSKGIGWFLTGSPTLFAETVHSLADVGNQVLLKIGEIRGRRGPTAVHPFGHGQEKFFWALVSAVSVFFIGCGINLYHGIEALLHPTEGGAFSPLVIGLLLFALALETWTLVVALRELGGISGIRTNLHNTTVVAVLLEDIVALFGIILTLIVAGIGYLFGPRPVFDASIAIVVGLLLGALAIFLAAINRRLLIDTSDASLDRTVERWLSARSIAARAHSLILDDDSVVVFVDTPAAVTQSHALGEALAAEIQRTLDKSVHAVYWKFMAPAQGTPAAA
jgi:zinc transporter 9